MPPAFFVSMAAGDTIGRFTDRAGDKMVRVSLTNIFPANVKENLLFSMSYKSDIHYDKMKESLDPLSVVEPLFEHQQVLPSRMFADCGAYQYRNDPKPILPNGRESNANDAWVEYQKRHLEKEHSWDEILLCAPDHMICDIKVYSKKQKKILLSLSPKEQKKWKKDNPPKVRKLKLGEFRSRSKFNRQQVKAFFELTKDEQRVTPVGVIHGHCDFSKDIKTRKKNLTEMIKLGYKYVALGGMVPYSKNQKKALKIIAGIKDIINPVIAKNSILGQCREKGIRLHVFGLTSPDWYRWLYRLGVDSFDGSKLATEGAVNGIFWVLNDGKGSGRTPPLKPKKVTEFYHKINVKDVNFDSWKWNPNDDGVLVPETPAHQKTTKDLLVDITCKCPACQYLRSARCPGKICREKNKLDGSKRHVCEPLMRGSNEHNMGRAAHNAHVYGKLIERIEELNQMADDSDLEGENEWLKHWTTIEVAQ